MIITYWLCIQRLRVIKHNNNKYTQMLVNYNTHQLQYYIFKHNLIKYITAIQQLYYIIIQLCSYILYNTVYVKSFERENFHGCCGFLLNANFLPLKNFFKYWCCPLTTQSMVTHHLINNEHVTWHVAYYVTTFQWLLHIDHLDFPFLSHKPAVLQLLVSSTHDRTVSFKQGLKFSCLFYHNTCVKCDSSSLI